jgi:hypothetical protein
MSGGHTWSQVEENNSLSKWVRQDWTTKSGRPSHVTGERYYLEKPFNIYQNRN